MKKHLIILKFWAPETFHRFYEWIKSGRMIVHTASPLPEGSTVLIKMLLPGIDRGILIDCRVVAGEAADGRYRLSLGVSDNLMLVMAEIDDLLGLHDDYRHMPGSSLPDVPAGPSVDTGPAPALEIAPKADIVEPEAVFSDQYSEPPSIPAPEGKGALFPEGLGDAAGKGVAAGIEPKPEFDVSRKRGLEKSELERLAADFENNSEGYAARLAAVENPEEALVYLKSLLWTVPEFMAGEKWEVLSKMVDTFSRAAGGNPVLSRQLNNCLTILENPEGPAASTAGNREKAAVFLFGSLLDQLAAAYQDMDNAGRADMSDLLDRLGMSGVEILSRVLARSNDRRVRKSAVASLQAKGETAREWALKIIEDDAQEWYVHRNALMILRNVSREEADFDRVRKFTKSPHSRLREEVVNLVLSLRPEDMEPLIIDALADTDARVRWRALRVLTDIPAINESTMDDLLSLLSNAFHRQEHPGEQARNTVQFMSAICALKYIPAREKVEAVALDIVKTVAHQYSGWRKLMKKASGGGREIAILKAGIPLLGRIGSDLSRNLLTGMLKSHAFLAEMIQTAIGRIERRMT